MKTPYFLRFSRKDKQHKPLKVPCTPADAAYISFKIRKNDIILSIMLYKVCFGLGIDQKYHRADGRVI